MKSIKFFNHENETSENPSQTTFADLGIPTEQQTRLTVIGTTRTCSSLTKWEWIYLVVSISSLLTSLILTLYTLYTLKTSKSAESSSFDFTFALVLIYTTLFCFYYVVHGVLKERPFELMVFVITISIILVYSVMNYYSKTSANELKLVRLILVCILGPGLIIAGIWFSREYYLSGNLIYRTVGANINLQGMCNTLFLCSTLLKFDLQLQGSMVLLVMQHGTDITTAESFILPFGLGVTVVFIAFGYLSMRLENRILVIVFLILSISEPVYIIYLFCIAKNTGILYRVTYLCGALALSIWASSIICMYFVMKNFGKGLKEKVYGNGKENITREISSNSNEEENTDKENT